MNQSVCVFKKDVKLVTEVKMYERLKTILENAIKEEEYFHSFYLYLAEKIENDEIKQDLRKLAEQELMHKEKLECLSFEQIGRKVIADKINEIDVAEEVALTPVEEFKDLKDMFAFAIKQETIAQTTYEQLASAVDDENAKKLFLILADEEKKHRLLLTGKLALIEEVD